MSLLARALSALPDATLGAVFLVTWLDPRFFGGGVLKRALLAMVMEFVVVHSSAIMGWVLWGTSFDALKKTLAAAGLGLMYSTVLTSIALAIGAWWPLWAFWGLTLNRLTNALLSRKAAKEVRARVTADWATSAVLYLLWVSATTVLWVPALGVTPQVVAAAGLPGTDLWVEQPYRVVVAGAGYFLCQAWVELRGTPLIGAKRS
jgi:hypothetical protein